MTVATAALDAPINVAGLLRRIADALPAMGGYTEDESAVLRQLADEQQQRKEEYDAWVRAKVARARAETGPGYTSEEMLAYVLESIDALPDAPEGD
ncbi:MAG: hypothetical protein IJR28_05765 [Ottowia sp.]|nr:hypothetical protein [Ottowia sp.]